MDINEYNKYWEVFEENCKNCNACGLREGANNVVVYRGSRLAPLMIVGEAPGEQEDQQGKPFVGKSGQHMQNLINALGFTSKHYHICNIIKCRPPQNRKPVDSEVAACKRLLAQQFKLVRPKIVLLCGMVAHQAFFGEGGRMEEVRGHFVEKNGYLLMTTYHPAYVLRNPDKRVGFYEDVEKIKNKMIELNLY